VSSTPYFSADVEEGIGLIAAQRGSIMFGRIEGGGEFLGTLAAQRVALEEFGAELRRFLRKANEQLGGGPG
jgi:hypothetical protein